MKGVFTLIQIWIPSIYANDNGAVIFGDAQVINDGENFEVIDGSSGIGTTVLINHLKENSIRYPYLHISHPHYDHYCGIREIINDDWFTPKGLYCPNPNSLKPEVFENEEAYKNVRVEVMNLKSIINDAKEKGIPVYYLEDGYTIEHGDIKIICYWNQQKVLKKDDIKGINYINNGSLSYWFPELRYWTSGDAGSDLCIDKGISPVLFKIPNHGKYFTWERAQALKLNGTLYCWDNNYHEEESDGEKHCIQSGITYINADKDINISFADGKAIISRNKKDWVYEIPYKGNFNEGWVKDSAGWWYRYKDGTWAIGWKKLKLHEKDAWFYFDESGYTVTGWNFIERNGEKNWFYFEPINGSLRTGWVKTDGLWFYLNKSDGALHHGWLDYKGKKCYFEPNIKRNQGQAYRNRIALIDGEIWEFDKDCYGKKIEL